MRADILSNGHSRGVRKYLKPFPLLRSAMRLVGSYAFYLARAATRLPVFKSRSFRKMVFDVAEANKFLVAGETEAFVISTSDKIIGRVVYATNAPFDFEKMKTVLSLLPGGQQRTLLIDIGANIGTICIPAVKRGFFQRAIAVEPEPRNFSLLLANIHINMLSDKIVAHNLALGPQDNAEVSLELSDCNFGDHRVRISDTPGRYNEESRTTIVARSETLDSVIKSVPANSLVWMDTQGFEGHVLSGASKSIRARIPMCLEFWPYGLRRNNGYSLFKEALLRGGYQTLFELTDPTPNLLTSDCLDALYQKIGDRSTDVLVV